MFTAVSEASRTFSPLSEALSNLIYKIISRVSEIKLANPKDMDVKECARLLQKTEYRMESADYVMEMLKNRNNK